MAYKFNPFTGTLDYYTSSNGNVAGIPPTNIGAIARWADTTGTTIENSPNTNVQDSGAIEAQGFISENHITGVVEIHAGETMTLASYMDLDGAGELIIDGDGELLIV